MERFQTSKKILIGTLNAAIVVGIGAGFLLANPAPFAGDSNPARMLDDNLKAISGIHRSKKESPAPTPSPTTEVAEAPSAAKVSLTASSQPPLTTTSRIQNSTSLGNQGGGGGGGGMPVVRPTAPSANQASTPSTINNTVSRAANLPTEVLGQSKPLLRGSAVLIGR